MLGERFLSTLWSAVSAGVKNIKMLIEGFDNPWRCCQHVKSYKGNIILKATCRSLNHRISQSSNEPTVEALLEFLYHCDYLFSRALLINDIERLLVPNNKISYLRDFSCFRISARGRSLNY